MKEITFTLTLLLMTICGFCGSVYAQQELTFQWEHSEAVVGDSFEIHYSAVSGSDYELLASITIEEETSIYLRKVEDINIPDEGYYFVVRYIRSADGKKSGWSNEVFWNPPARAFNLKLIFGDKE